MQDYRKLQVWQKAHKLALSSYDVSAYLQKPEGWPLRDQLLRAAISIASNIAEGRGRGSDPDFRRFLNLARVMAKKHKRRYVSRAARVASY